jgi:chorismate mutase-like protein
MPGVAAYKLAHDLPVEDRAREQALLTRLTDQGQLSGLTADAIRIFFRTQINLAKQVQQETLAAQTHVPDWARRLDLNTQLRPILTELSRRIVYELDQVSHGLHQLSLETFSEQQFQSWAQYEITTQQLSPQAKQQLGRAIWKVVQAGESRH